MTETTTEHTAVVSIGVRDNGEIDISSTNSNIAVIQWLLSRAAFEVNLIEYQDRKKAGETDTKKPPEAPVE
jgi:hypothetical protein